MKFIGLCFFAALAHAAAPTSPTSNSILKQVKTDGAKPVLLKIFSDPALEDSVLEGIATGSAEWLRVARELKPVSDAAAAESLDLSVARALPVAPERVLRLAGKVFPLKAICTSPFIEPEPGVAEAYQRRTVKALQGVKAPELQRKKVACLAAVSNPLRPIQSNPE